MAQECDSLPPLDEQRWIVAKEEQRMALVDALEACGAVARASAADLAAELTTDAQNPSWLKRDNR